MYFTFEEMNLMCIYKADTRQELMDSLREMKEYLEPDEQDLLDVTNATLDKLENMSDASFAELELVPDFDL